MDKKEKQLSDLMKTIKEREVTRKSKMDNLQVIVVEGEESMARMQQSASLMAQTMRSALHRTDSKSVPGSPNSPTKRSLQTADRKRRAVQDEALRKVVEYVKEMKSRYDSRKVRKDKLDQMVTT